MLNSNEKSALIQHDTYRPNTPAELKSAPKDGKMSKVIAVCVAVMLAFAMFIVIAGNQDQDETYKKIDIQTITTDTYFELSGDFLPELGIFTVSITDDGQIAFALNDDISSEYDYYSWTFFDVDHVSSTNTRIYSQYVGEGINKAEPVLYYLEANVGEYNISVDCYVNVNGHYQYSTTYSGTVSYVGTITKEYSWMYESTEYSVTITFDYDEYRQYRDLNTNGRAVTNYEEVVSFVTYEDPVIESLADSLLETYGSQYTTTDQEFAMFVLAFIQICFDYPPYSNFMDADEYQYGQKEYFAYPLETIFYGMGDCEDTSILAAALFKALGYDAGVVIIPGHAVAAVALSTYDPGTYSTSSFEVLSTTIDGKNYYGCETTVNRPQGIGLITLSGYMDRPYSSYIGELNYGFYIV